MYRVSMKQVMRDVKEKNNMEDKIAKELFGKSFEELDYDEKDEVLCFID